VATAAVQSVVHPQRCRITREVSDGGGPVRTDRQLTWPARIRSSEFLGRSLLMP